MQEFAMTENRKRGRNHSEEEVEFMPLSKRINNLHINNSLLLEQHNNALKVEWGPGPPNQFCQLPESPPSSEPGIDFPPQPEYAPDLNESQNPHYFNINKLLFEMYLQRLQRGCHQI